MAKPPKYLLWCDLETTGTDECLDRILEVGVCVTDPDLDLVGEFESTVGLTPDGSARLSDNEFVTRMHKDNGLLQQLALLGGAPELRSVESALCESLRALGKPHEFMLAGSGVGHFDRRFIRAQMPGFEKLLQYPVIDVGVTRRMLELWNPSAVYPRTSDKAHRALADARDHLEEARHYKRLLERL